MHNITNVVVIINNRHVCKGEIYVWLIIINLCIGNKLFCGGGGIIKYKVRGVCVIGVIKC